MITYNDIFCILGYIGTFSYYCINIQVIYLRHQFANVSRHYVIDIINWIQYQSKFLSSQIDTIILNISNLKLNATLSYVSYYKKYFILLWIYSNYFKTAESKYVCSISTENK